MIGGDRRKNYRAADDPRLRLARLRYHGLFGMVRIVRARNARAAGGVMRPVSLAIRAALMPAVVLPRAGLAEDYGQATVNPMLLAEQDLTAGG
jgi:hypothetical protein